jgi:uncharacterized protein (UPF0335 family)
MSTIGHNSAAEVGGIAADRLMSIIERIERLNEEKKALSSDISDIFAEAKGAGFDPKVIRQVIKERAMDEADREEQRALRDLYLQAVGIL